ncbi:MAG: tRNA epoxyqueuosine(34) reductase QueG [Sedimentisphaerales bacterium]|nr:tRNA epoxyqueuosine(34) reductase QueG [Sedimentisphaerales bacterium]
MLNAADVKQWAVESGFDLAGVTTAAPVDSGAYFSNWLSEGRYGPLDYLARNVARRLDVRQLVPGARSVICVALNYYNPLQPRPAGGVCGRVARCAWGRDYHLVVKNKLYRLARRIHQSARQAVTRCFVGSAPLFEKALAARAGLGWIGKNGLLLNEQFGSWLVLGEIVTNMELEPDEPIAEKCGACACCLDACPTKALYEPYHLDARRCISCWTIETKQDAPPDVAARMGDRIFGCDKCQEVCPFNQDVPASTHSEFAPRPGQIWLDLQQLEGIDEAQFQQKFQDTGLLRPGLDGLKRNAKILLRENSAGCE